MSKISTQVRNIIESNVVIPFEYQSQVDAVVTQIEAAAFAIGDRLLSKAEDAGYDVEAVRDILVDAGLQPEPEPEPVFEDEDEDEDDVAEDAASGFVTKEEFKTFSTSVTDALDRLTRLAERHLGASL